MKIWPRVRWFFHEPEWGRLVPSFFPGSHEFYSPSKMNRLVGRVTPCAPGMIKPEDGAPSGAPSRRIVSSPGELPPERAHVRSHFGI
jgi:hypothetical protein